MSNEIGPFDQPYWNLAQAAAWVVYRDRKLVERFENVGPLQFGAIGMYPSMDPKAKNPKGTLPLLRKALADGRLDALGRRESDTAPREPIPMHEWNGLVLRPPYAYAAENLTAQIQPWQNILVPSADVKKLWRSSDEVAGRSRIDWSAVKAIHDDQKSKLPDVSQNRLIDEIQRAFEERFNKKPPSRTSLQTKIKSWR